MARPQALYRFFAGDGSLLYIGISADPGARWKQHRGDKPWWSEVATVTLETFATRDEVVEAERWAIAREAPRYNIVHAAADWTRDVPIGPDTWGALAEQMPDDCHDHCAPTGLLSMYYPYRWEDGRVYYQCSNGHRWTCGWGHLNSGEDPSRRGVPIDQRQYAPF